MKIPTGTDEQVWAAILQREPALAALFSRQPSYRYFSHKGWRYCYTTERLGDGKFAAFVYRPVGKGARTGKARTFKLVREVRVKKRKDARARALKWVEAAEAKAAVA